MTYIYLSNIIGCSIKYILTNILHITSSKRRNTLIKNNMTSNITQHKISLIDFFYSTYDDSKTPENEFPKTFQYYQIFLLAFISLAGFELYLNHLLPFVCDHVLKIPRDIPRRGKHLDVLDLRCRLYITFSKMMVPVFMYHLFRFSWFSKSVKWDMMHCSIVNTVLPVPLLFLLYDMIYQPFHRLLHWPPLYPYIHKHHHRQMIPTRGNDDAINVHPIEFVSGEYMHLISIMLYCKYVGTIYIGTIVAFMLIGGTIATVNHTRLNILIPGLIGVKYHDIHHSLAPFEINYSQYTMFWDRIYGTFREDKPFKKKKAS